MPFFVVVQYQARPDHLDPLLAALRDDFAVSASQWPGRRFGRVYRHHREPTRLLAIEEWQQEAEFEHHTRSSRHAETVGHCVEPPRTDALQRLQHYRHMPHLPLALLCVTVSAPADRASEAEDFICDQQRREALLAEGLVLRAVYRLPATPGRLMILHGWRSLGDLTTFLATHEHTIASSLAPIGAQVEQFTGEIAAEYSWLAS